MKNKIQRYILLIVLVCVLTLFTGETAWLQVSEVRGITEGDQKSCQDVVEGFCQAWMKEAYAVMYQALSKAGMGLMDQERFISTYRSYGTKGGKLIKYSLTQGVKKERDLMVKADLKFIKEIPPRIVNGVHNFHMVKGEGGWKIKYIMPPISPPALSPHPGGSHPGE